MKKSDLKKLVKHAYNMKAKTDNTEVVFQIYSQNLYILDAEEDCVLEVTDTEEEAIELINVLEEGGCNDLYYKPILIDADSGERVTRRNFQYYDLESDFVKELRKTLEEYNTFVHGN
jgi:hypothetical protein